MNIELSSKDTVNISSIELNPDTKSESVAIGPKLNFDSAPSISKIAQEISHESNLTSHTDNDNIVNNHNANVTVQGLRHRGPGNSNTNLNSNDRKLSGTSISDERNMSGNSVYDRNMSGSVTSEGHTTTAFGQAKAQNLQWQSQSQVQQQQKDNGPVPINGSSAKHSLNSESDEANSPTGGNDQYEEINSSDEDCQPIFVPWKSVSYSLKQLNLQEVNSNSNTVNTVTSNRLNSNTQQVQNTINEIGDLNMDAISDANKIHDPDWKNKFPNTGLNAETPQIPLSLLTKIKNEANNLRIKRREIRARRKKAAQQQSYQSSDSNNPNRSPKSQYTLNRASTLNSQSGQNNLNKSGSTVQNVTSNLNSTSNVNSNLPKTDSQNSNMSITQQSQADSTVAGSMPLSGLERANNSSTVILGNSASDDNSNNLGLANLNLNTNRMPLTQSLTASTLNTKFKSGLGLEREDGYLRLVSIITVLFYASVVGWVVVRVRGWDN